MPGRRASSDTLFVLLLLAIISILSACQTTSSKATSTTTTNTTAAAPTGSKTTAPSFTVVQVVRRDAQGDNVPGGKIGMVTATCEPGEQMLSGGYYVYAWEAEANVVASYPSGPNAWTVTDDNTHGTDLTITAYANCLQAPYSVGLRLVSSTSLSSGTPQATTIACPSGAVLTGGGFQVAGGIAALTPTAHGWRIMPGGVGKVFALCATERLRAAPATSATFTTKMVFGSPQGGSAHCPDGQIVTGGGYSFAQGETFIAVNALAPDAASWNIGAAGGYNAVSVVVWATCVIAPQS